MFILNNHCSTACLKLQFAKIHIFTAYIQDLTYISDATYFHLALLCMKLTTGTSHPFVFGLDALYDQTQTDNLSHYLIQKRTWSQHTHLHIKLERKANKEVFITDISTISEVNNMVTIATWQPISYQINCSICCVFARWYKHCLWHTERCVNINTLNLLDSEIITN